MTQEMAKYLALFSSEARDRLGRLSAGLVELEGAARSGADTRPIVDELFRHAHSVKGMSASMQLEGIARLAHRVEDLVDGFRRRAAVPDPPSVDVLLAAIDALGAMVEAAAEGASPEPEAALLERVVEAARRAREEAAAGQAPAPGAPGAEAAPREATGPSAPPVSSGTPAAPPLEPGAAAPPGHQPAQSPPPLATRRLTVEAEIAGACPVPSVRGFLVVNKLARLGAVAAATPSVEELRSGRIPGRKVEVVLETGAALAEVERALAQVSDLSRVAVREEEAPPPPASPAREERQDEGGRTVRIRVDLLDSFLDAVGELILATDRLRVIGRGVPEPHRPALEEGVDRLHATVKDLHDKVMAVRMTPLAVLTERLPRAARDAARRAGKQVEVEVSGAGIEIDRAILDELGDPLLHVLRNAVDHGIEAPHLRQLIGKPATGRITVAARRERDRVVLEVADDGKGMDPDGLRAAAVARGAVSAAEAATLTLREVLFLACLPGVSTAEEVTELSGRGVGMDAVKRTVDALGGALEVESAPGAGTRWTLRLPLTVAVQPVLLVGVGEEVLGLPIAKVHGAAQVDLARLERSQGAPVLAYDGKLVPVKELGGLLGFPAPAGGGTRSVVIADGEGVRVGLAVDALLGQQEAVLKPLHRPLDRVVGLSAVTVLGNGRPVFILDVQRLVAA